MDRGAQGSRPWLDSQPGSFLKTVIAEVQGLLVLGRGLGARVGFKFPGDCALQSRGP